MKLHRELTFLNNSIIYKNVELKFSMDTYSGPLISENNINPIPHGIFCITHTLGGGGGLPIDYNLACLSYLLPFQNCKEIYGI